VIVSSDVFNVAPRFVTAVPSADITARLGVPVPGTASGYSMDLAVLARQPLTLDPSRFPDQPVGVVPPALMDKIDADLKMQFEL
jgi:mRNA-degrading endonuclease toxin of MazEF toxin-antitoxin module